MPKTCNLKKIYMQFTFILYGVPVSECPVANSKTVSLREV